MAIVEQQKHEHVGGFIARNHWLESSLLNLNGTGGDPAAWPMDATGFAPLVCQDFRLAPERDKPDPIIAMIAVIQSTFDLTVQELAAASGVTRKAAHDWKAGNAEPRQSHLTRLYRLREAALSWQADAFPSPGQARALPIIGDQSLIDLLNADPLDLQAIHFAGNRLQLESLNQAQPSIADPFS